MTHEEMLKAALADISKLTLTGPLNWNLANGAINKISAVIEGLKKEREAREAAYRQSVEDANKNRAKLAKEAAERGEELVGGETYVIDLKGGGKQ